MSARERNNYRVDGNMVVAEYERKAEAEAVYESLEKILDEMYEETDINPALGGQSKTVRVQGGEGDEVLVNAWRLLERPFWKARTEMAEVIDRVTGEERNRELEVKSK